MATSDVPGSRREISKRDKSVAPAEARNRASANDLIKLSANGEPDWKTLGNIITADLLGEVLCASYADFKYGKRSKDFKPAIDWEFSYEQDDVLVFTKHQSSSSSSVCFLARGVIELPVCVVAAFIHNLQNYPLWNKFMTESRVVDVLSESDYHRSVIGYFCHDMKKFWSRGRRDLCLFLHSSFSADKYIHAAISIEHHLCPPIKSVTRAQCFSGSGWVVEPYEGKKNKSLVSYICDLDLMDGLPESIIKTFVEKQPMAVHYLKLSITEQIRNRKQRQHSRKPSKKTKGATTSSDERVEDASARPLNLNDSLDSVDFGTDALASFVCVNTIARQYEDPVGISEFVGYKATPSRKCNSRKRHQCCGRTMGDLSLEIGAKDSWLGGTDMCADCAMADGHRNGAGNRTRYTYT